MNQPVIEFRNVCKRFQYRRHRPDSLKDTVLSLLNGSYFNSPKEEKIVLDQVSFSIREGEILAIMGRNGTGKSTLLRILSGIYQADSGEVIVRKRVAPLVAVGTGFHPDLSGYENIFLNGAILGIPREELIRVADHIIDFAELRSQIHHPIKSYSSGMTLRLGFSVAAFVDAPILVLDEILTVGDEGFQRKCLKKINELFDSGRTIILVTHDPHLAKSFCNRCIVLENGKVAYDGPPEKGAQVYSAMFS